MLQAFKKARADGRTRDEEDEEDAFDRWMRLFNPDVEGRDEEGVIAENHEEAEEGGLYRK